MLTHPTVDKLHALRCTGMATALAEQLGSPQVEALSFEERLGLLVDRELTERNSRQLTNRLRRARLRHAACVEDIDFRQPRGLDKDLVLSLADGRWIRDHLNLLITGPAGVGKRVAKYVLPPADRPCHGRCPIDRWRGRPWPGRIAIHRFRARGARAGNSGSTIFAPGGRRAPRCEPMPRRTGFRRVRCTGPAAGLSAGGC